MISNTDNTFAFRFLRAILQGLGAGRNSHLQAHWTVTPIGANRKPNSSCHKNFILHAFLLHSKRKISTGDSLAASRAGITVASMAMPIAARAIHRPSKKLGLNGTNGTA
jgi:hypothetical protein